MSAQDNTEKVLRSLHIMLSKSPLYDKEPSKVLIDKQKMLDLLNELNQCIYKMQESYELTQQSRDKAEREFRKRGDEIVLDASRKAEDIYAASVMYTDEALNSIQEIMQKSNDSLQLIYQEMDRKLQEQEHIVRSNQLELKSQLQDLTDTEKYLKLIEDRNREIEKEKAEKEGKGEELLLKKKERAIYANRQTEIKINPEYFEKAGNPIAEDLSEDEETDIPEDTSKAAQEVKVNLDSEYFQWKEKEQNQEIPDIEKNKQTKDITGEIQKVWKNLTSGKK